VKSLVTIHATMTGPGMKLTGRDVDKRDRLHGYSKCCYHYVIQRDGVVWQGRQDSEPSVHDGLDAKAAISVCLVGGADERNAPENNFTLPQWDSLRTLIKALGLTPHVKTPALDCDDIGKLIDKLLN
jgi:N-acetylmuramoyl-L-alanine amidase